MRGKLCKTLRKASKDIANLIIEEKLKPEIAGFIYKLRRKDMKSVRHTYRALKKNVRNGVLKVENGIIHIN